MYLAIIIIGIIIALPLFIGAFLFMHSLLTENMQKNIMDNPNDLASAEAATYVQTYIANTPIM